MDWFHLLVALCIFLIFTPLNTKSHLLPDDLLTDDAEQLERERRSGGFFDHILKAFPWFNKKTNESEEEEEENETEDITNNKIADPIVQDVLSDDDITASFPGFDIHNLAMPFKDLLPSSARSNSLLEPTSDNVKPTETVSSLLQTSSHSSLIGSSAAAAKQPQSSTPLLSSMIQPSSVDLPTESVIGAPLTTSSGSSSKNLKSSLIEPSTVISSSSSSAHVEEDSSISPTQTISATVSSTTHISVPTATVFSSSGSVAELVEPSSSLEITPTPTIDSFLYLSTMSPSLGDDDVEKDQKKLSPFVEIIMGSGPPRLPDEKGYGGEVYGEC